MPALAALGGDRMRSESYPAWPVYDNRDIQAVTDVIQSGQWGGAPFPGPISVKFTNKFLEMQGGNFAVPMMNGTISLEVALRAAEIGWGDEVIVPAYTFQATAVAPMAAGAIPVIVDVDRDTYCIDPEKVREAITPRTRAIIVVHLGASMTDMDAILGIADEHGLVVIEDAAHAHGARWNNRGAGTIGHFGSFSLQSSKILTTGEGGMLICKTAELAERAASIIDCGRPKDLQRNHYTMGANFRLPEIQAALGLVALDRFSDQISERAAMAGYLEESLSELEGVRLLKRDLRHTQRSFYRYIIAIDPEVFHSSHHAVCYALNAEGIPSYAGYPPLHQCDLFQPGISKLPVPSAFPEYFKYDQFDFPVAERACHFEAVWLSENIFRSNTKGIDDVVKALNKLMQHGDELELIDSMIKEKYSKYVPETIPNLFVT